MSKRLITNNEARIIQIQIAHNSPTGLIQLAPGTNEIDADTWEQAEKLPMVKIWMKTPTENPETRGKTMIEVGDKLPDVKTLAGLAPAKVRDALADTFDVKLLAKWRAEERRPDVMKMIDERIGEIERNAKAAAAVLADGGNAPGN